MLNLAEKIRKVFTRKSDTYVFENSDEDDNSATNLPGQNNVQKKTPTGKNGGVISKATAKRLNNTPEAARNSSLTSSQLNIDVPLIRSNRLPSINSICSKSSPESPPPNIGNRSTSTPKFQLNRKSLIRQKPIEINSIRLKSKLLNNNNNNNNKPKNTPISNTRKGSLSKLTSTSADKPKNNIHSSPFSNRILKKPKSFPDLSNKRLATINNNNNNSPKAINRNIEAKLIIPKGTTPTHVQKRSNLNLEIRGQGPSGSKNSASGQNQTVGVGHIKSSSSISSLDGIGLKKSKIHHGSKDKLDQQQQQQIFKNSKDKIDRGSSRDRISDICSDPVSKSKKKNNSQMPIIQQNVVANNNLIDQRDVTDYNNHHHQHHHNHSDKNLSRDITDINFDGPREATRQQTVMQELQSHLERLTREKMALEAKIVELSSYQTEVIQLRNEIAMLQNIQEKSNNEIQKLTDENETLRNRLRDVVNSPLSDAEKHQIIQDSQRLHSSAPASIALPNNHEADGTPCVTPDWDKQSSNSEFSVACLQDKIIQMEETHYSTNEELQATLQELADLQSQLTELQTDNERLAEEKDVLFQSLCRQTEKLEDSRTQIGTLQELLLRESNQQDIGTTEREQKLLDLLKNAQEERESLLIKQEELNSDMNELRQSIENGNNENSRLRERISLLDSTVDATTAERKQTESQLLQAKEDQSEKQIEISRLTTLLENARSKIDEYEQDRAMGDKSDLGELLDTARKEKDLLEGQVASLQEQVSKSQCEIQKLRDQVAGITEECKVARNNAKCTLSDLEYKYEQLKEEKMKLYAEYQQLQDNTNELQVQCKCHLEDKAQLEGLLSEAQRRLGEAERLLAEKEEKLQDEMKLRRQEAEEWEQFQSDLLMTVRVANDFKTEAQVAREQLVMDNKAQREKIRMLEQQIEKLNKQVSTDAQQSLLNTVQLEMAARRQKVGISRQDSRLSVKSLIESIENVNKQTKSAGPGSRCSSSSSLNSVTSEALNGSNGISGVGNVVGGCSIINNNQQNGTTRGQINDWSENVIQQNQLHTPAMTGIQAKSPLREQQQTAGSNINMNGSQKGLITGERKDPLNALVKNGGSKRNALLKWCQNKTVGYRNIDITNFSSSWNDGLAFCAILHSYLPDRVPYDTLGPNNKRRNFSIAFSAAESVGIQTSLNINEMCQQERPDWTQVMAYVTAIYKHFET